MLLYRCTYNYVYQFIIAPELGISAITFNLNIVYLSDWTQHYNVQEIVTIETHYRFTSLSVNYF